MEYGFKYIILFFYYFKGNGRVEVVVKVVEIMLKKVDDFYSVLFFYRNILF